MDDEDYLKIYAKQGEVSLDERIDRQAQKNWTDTPGHNQPGCIQTNRVVFEQ